MAIGITLVYIILSMLSPADLIPELYPMRPMLVLTALALIASLASILQDQRSLAIPQMPFILGFYAMIMISRIMTGWVGGAYEALLQFSVQFFTFLLIMLSANSVNRIRWIGAALVFVCFYYVLRCTLAMEYGISLEKFTLEQWLARDPYTDEPITFRRAKGLGYLDDPNDLSQFYLASLPFLWLLWRKGRSIRNLVFVLVPTSAVFYGLYLTHSRGSLIGIFVLLAMVTRRKFGLGGPILSAGFTAFLLLVVGYGGGRVFSATSDSGGGRIELWSESIGLFRGSPIWGIGFGRIFSYLPNTSHNSLVLALTEVGAVGAFVWLALLVTTILQLRRIAALADQGHAEEPIVRLASAVILSLSGWIATAWFLSVTYTVTLFILLGLSAAVWLEARRRFPDMEPVAFPRILGTTFWLLIACFVVIYVLIRVRWAG